MNAPADQTRLIKRLRIALVLVAMFTGICIVAVLGILFYWNSFLLEQPKSDPFTRGPFVADVSADSAIVRFLGPDPATVTLVAAAPDGTTFEAEGGVFRGLEAGQRYIWTAVIDGAGRASGSFQTAPEEPDAPVTFGVIGDYGSGNEHEYAVGRGLAAIDPAFTVTTGDNSYLLALPQVLNRNIFKPLLGVMQEGPLVVTLGDHDTFYDDGKAITDAIGMPGAGLLYTWEHGPVQIIILGNQGDAASIAYANAELAKPFNGVRFATVHTPLQPGDPLADVLRGKVAAVFSGHLHRQERRIVDGVLAITAGTGGKGPGNEEFTKQTAEAVFSTMDYGFVRVQVTAAESVIQFIDEAGRVRDVVSVPREG